MSKKRHESLIPLSHQHHHGLVLSHRLQQGLPKRREDHQAVATLAKEVVEFFDRDLVSHFTAEEEALFPAMEQHLGGLAIINELLQEHRRIRSLVDQLRQSRLEAQVEPLLAFGELLRDHIRKEERVLFPIFEEKMPASEVDIIGNQIQQKLKP
jgi:hemerythrin-like domain-containing protein